MSDSAVPSSAAAAVPSDSSAAEGVSSPGAPASADSKSPKAPGGLQASADAVDKKAVAQPEGAAADGEGKKETAAEKKARILRGKVNGTEMEWDVDSMDDATLAKKLQMAEAFHKRTNELSAREKKIQEAIAYGKENTTEALKDLFGIEDPYAWAEQLLTKKYGEDAKRATMTPEQVEAEKLRGELEQYKARELQAKEAQKAQAREAMNRKILEDTRNKFGEALEKSGLPKTQRVMAQMAHLMKTSLKHGITLTADQLAAELKSEFSGGLKQVATSLDGERLLAELGDDVVNKVIRAKLAKVGKTPVPVAAPTPTPRQDGEDDEVPPGTPIWMRSAFRTKK